MLEVARFNKNITIKDKKRFYLLKRKKCEKSQHFNNPLGVDHKNIYSGNGEESIFSYRKGCNIVLTKKEKEIIYEFHPDIKPPIVLEDLFPWIDNIKFLNNSKKSYQYLSFLLKKYSNFLDNPTSISDKYWNNICNKQKFSNSLVDNFYFAWHVPLQNTHIIYEKSLKNKIIAVDFNSMYAFGVLQSYPHIDSLKHIEINDKSKNVCLSGLFGIFYCRLSPPFSDFLKSYMPFTTWANGRRFLNDENSTINVKLNEFEISFYEKHVEEIFIFDACVSTKTQKHPLYKQTSAKLKERKSFKLQNNASLAALQKFNIVLAASSSERNVKKTIVFNNLEELFEFFEEKYGLCISGINDFKFNIDYFVKKFNLVVLADGRIRISDIKSNEQLSCPIFMQRIISHSRIKLLELMESFLSAFPSIKVAYYNIDSLHFVVPGQDEYAFMEYLNGHTGEEVGELKVDCVADAGLWLQPGKYWLLDRDSNILKFANSGLGDFSGELTHFKKSFGSLTIKNQTILSKRTITLKSSLSDMYALLPSEDDKLLLQKKYSLTKEDTNRTIIEKLDSTSLDTIKTKLTEFDSLKNGTFLN